MSYSVTRILPLVLLCLVASACAADTGMKAAQKALDQALPPQVAARVKESVAKDPKGFLALLQKAGAEAAACPDLFRRVDKQVVLGPDYLPRDLVALDGTALSVSRPGHRLRKPALEALLVMDRAARRDGISLVVGSAFRSYDYQVEVFARTVKEEGGEVAADRISARPGKSQHQLGMALDFSPIDDAFAQTQASRWLEAHASAYGFSLSFPKGYEAVTGYAWESWHWRYIGLAGTALQRDYFGGIQQYLIQFWEAYTSRK